MTKDNTRGLVSHPVQKQELSSTEYHQRFTSDVDEVNYLVRDGWNLVGINGGLFMGIKYELHRPIPITLEKE